MLAPIKDLMRPPAGMEFDFSQPFGEPALTPLHGVSWRLFANPVSLFIGGVAAVLVELAEPVRSLPQLRGRDLRFGEANIVRAFARLGALLPLGDMPPAQAARCLASAS